VKRRALWQAGRGPLLLWLVASVLACIGWDLYADHALQILNGYLLLTAGLGIWAALGALLPVSPVWGRTEFDRAFEQARPRLVRPEELEHVERVVSFSPSNAMDTHMRLLPLLREIADAQLVARYGAGLNAEPEVVRERLGTELWERIRPRPEPADRFAPGMHLRDLASSVEALEHLAGR